MQSDYVSKTCYNLQVKIDSGSFDIENLYVELIKRINTFLIKLEEFATKQSNIELSHITIIDIDIDKTKIEEFKNLSKQCDALESKLIRAKLFPEHEQSISKIKSLQ
jgi:nitrogenase subunit NifH